MGDCTFIKCAFRSSYLTAVFLNGSVFSGTSTAGTTFEASSIHNSSLADCDLSGFIHINTVAFNSCDVTDVFVNDLDIKRIDLFSEIAKALDNGWVLDMDYYHHPNNDKAHCLAGLAVRLHPQGQSLEKDFGTLIAGALIFRACHNSAPYFFWTTEYALEWLNERTKN